MSEQKEKMTIILFSGELDKAIAAFTLATTAAASGMEATIFFTFWGLNVLKKNMFVIDKINGMIQIGNKMLQTYRKLNDELNVRC